MYEGLGQGMPDVTKPLERDWMEKEKKRLLVEAGVSPSKRGRKKAHQKRAESREVSPRDVHIVYSPEKVS